jgi:hypothetical protein
MIPNAIVGLERRSRVQGYFIDFHNEPRAALERLERDFFGAAGR